MRGRARQQLPTKAFVTSQTNFALRQTSNNGEQVFWSDTVAYQHHSGVRQMLRAIAGISGAAMEQGITSAANISLNALTISSIQSGLSISTSAFSSINDEVEKIDKDLLIRSSFSIEVTSSDDTLWTKYHSAQEHDKDRPGVTHVDGDSQYRVASITKVLTTLGLLYQHESGKVSLDDPIDKYIPELKEADRGELPWKDITLRILASQL